MAESIYIENHAINEAIEMYQSMYKWDEAIELAEYKVNFKCFQCLFPLFKIIYQKYLISESSRFRQVEKDLLSMVNRYRAV